MKNIFAFRLRQAPLSVKALATGYLLSISLAYVYALGNIAFVVGLTPKSIAVHYYGADKKIEVNQTEIQTGEETFSLDDIADEAPKLEVGSRPSFKNLVGVGHFHLFGMSSFFFGLAFLGLFTSVSEGLKSLMVLTPFIAVILDNLSFLATRFLGPSFAYLTAISGAIMGISFSVLFVAIAIELLAKRNIANA